MNQKPPLMIKSVPGLPPRLAHIEISTFSAIRPTFENEIQMKIVLCIRSFTIFCSKNHPPREILKETRIKGGRILQMLSITFEMNDTRGEKKTLGNDQYNWSRPEPKKRVAKVTKSQILAFIRCVLKTLQYRQHGSI